MKNLIIVLLVVLPGIARCQSDSLPVKRHELGVNVFAAQFFSFDYRNRFVLPGIFYRRYYGRNVIRASVEARQKFHDTGEFEANIKNSSNSATYISLGDSSHWKRNTFDLRIGYERILGKHPRIQPYVFSELGGQLIQVDGWYMRRYDPVDTVRQPLNAQTVAIGLTGGAGIRWEFRKQLAVCFEADFFVSARYYKHEKNESTVTGEEREFDVNHIRTLGISWRF